MARKDSENQKKSMGAMFRGRAINHNNDFMIANATMYLTTLANRVNLRLGIGN